MTISSSLEDRSGGTCELCSDNNKVSEYIVPPKVGHTDDEKVVICDTCQSLMADESGSLENIDHWRCLNDAIWSAVPAVKVLSYRILSSMPDVLWAQDLLSMMYLDEEASEWARAGSSDDELIHKDSHGNVLKDGDTVTLIKDLPVKGANFTAKRGTAVRRISLVSDNAEHIQGRVNHQTIIILTKYVKK